MSSPAPPLLPIAPLHGESGYLRWRESVLLRLHTLDVAHVLTEERPDDERSAAGKQWARADAMCRGHILATLSDRLLQVYAPHATAAAVWRAVARTYDLDIAVDDPTYSLPYEKAVKFRYAEGEPVTEQLALLEGLATNAELNDTCLCLIVKDQFPTLRMAVIKRKYRVGVDKLWEIARRKELAARVEYVRNGRTIFSTRSSFWAPVGDAFNGSSTMMSESPSRREVMTTMLWATSGSGVYVGLVDGQVGQYALSHERVLTVFTRISRSKNIRSALHIHISVRL
uniref:Uncharacterized protein n=1 Tax=Aegilops tauschii TaxID=37682 RepID=M8BBP6_AEGTA